TNSIRKMINNYCLNENYSNSRSEVINNALINYLIKNDEKNEKD
ncbi:spore coat protein CotS, partial [Mycoplasmopsis pullorum]